MKKKIKRYRHLIVFNWPQRIAFNTNWLLRRFNADKYMFMNEIKNDVMNYILDSILMVNFETEKCSDTKW